MAGINIATPFTESRLPHLEPFHYDHWAEYFLLPEQVFDVYIRDDGWREECAF